MLKVCSRIFDRDSGIRWQRPVLITLIVCETQLELELELRVASRSLK